MFHSFEQFSIPTGGTASFRGVDPEIANVLARVTGSGISNIDGLIEVLQTDGRVSSADFFLLNPNGIVFGENASLNVGGSFLTSTASSIIFADGTEFSTTNTQTGSLLTITAPIGLGFGSNPGDIINRSIITDESVTDLIGLRVQPDQTLALVGGDVLIEGGFLSTEGGRIELGSVEGNNFVSLISTNQRWALGYERVQNFRDIRLSQMAIISNISDEGGDIQIQGRRVTLTEGSIVAVITQPTGQAGNLIVRASESVELEGTGFEFGFNSPTFLGNNVDGEAIGRGSKLTVETERLIVRNGAQISASTFGAGQGVDLEIRASEIELEGTFFDADNPTDSLPSGLFARSNAAATGRGGSLTIDTERLVIQNGAQASTETFGAGDAGDLIVNASELVELVGTIPTTNIPSALFANVGQATTATGNGGMLVIRTGRLVVQNGAQIGTTAQNQGQGGKLEITADSILLSGTSPQAEFRGLGRSGILVSAEPLLRDEEGIPIRDEEGNLFITTANAGTLSITAGELTVEDGAIISADTFGIGEGGNINLNVGRLIVREGGQIGAGSLLERDVISERDVLNNERGPGGTLTINFSDSVEVIGTGIIGSEIVNSALLTQAEGTGDAGDLTLRTGSLTVRDGAEITVSSEGSGRAGNLIVTADTIRLDGGRLTAETQAVSGANIRLQDLDLLLMRNQSLISANAAANANGGNITIDADLIVAVPEEDSNIRANAFKGRGGNIDITTQGIFGIEVRERDTPLSDITASSDRGVQGVVTINAPEVDPSQGIIELPATPVTTQFSQACGNGDTASTSRFINSERGGLPTNPYEPLSGSDVLDDVQLPDQFAASPESSTNNDIAPPEQIVEAQGWRIDEQGKILLVADATPIAQASCQIH